MAGRNFSIEFLFLNLSHNEWEQRDKILSSTDSRSSGEINTMIVRA